MGDTGIVQDVEREFLEFVRSQPGDFEISISKRADRFYISVRNSELPEGGVGEGVTFAIAWSDASTSYL